MYAPTPLVNASIKQETYISMISAIRPIFNFIASSTKFTEQKIDYKQFTEIPNSLSSMWRILIIY